MFTNVHGHCLKRTADITVKFGTSRHRMDTVYARFEIRPKPTQTTMAAFGNFCPKNICDKSQF